jgi:hypothetical protein
MAMLFRQTNVIWMVFTAGTVVLQKFSDSNNAVTRGELAKVTQSGKGTFNEYA